MPSPTAAVRRRSVVAAGLVATGTTALAGGCGIGSGGIDPREKSTFPTLKAADEADGDLTDRVADLVATAAALAAATAQSVPALRGTARSFQRLHESHGIVLGGLPDVDEPTVPTARGRALTRLLRSELDTQEELVAASIAATSGSLAQTFAAMAAAIAQRRAQT